MAALQARLSCAALFVAISAFVIVAASSATLAQERATAVPRRIVSLVPATTEMLFAMGAGGQLVGVGSYDRYPPDVSRLPRLGGLLDPDIERVITLRPDLVIVYDTQTELKSQLERAAIPVWGYTHSTLGDVTATVRALGARVGRQAEGARTADAMERALDAVRARVSGRPRPRTLLVFGREAGTLRGINASGGYGFLHDLLVLAGGADVLADIQQPAVTMSSEMVLARAPEVIIELHYGEEWPPARVEAERRVWSALLSVPAVRTNRVHLLVGDEFVVPGPRVTIAAQRLADVLHPEVLR